MLFILVLLFLPCAIVGAFVTADDHDLTAFQTVFSFQPPSGALHGRSDAVAKDRSPARSPVQSYSGMTTRKDKAPTAMMLVAGSPNQLPTTSRCFVGNDGGLSCPSRPVLLWPAAATCTSGFFGVAPWAGDKDCTDSSSARRRRGRSSAARSAAGSDTVLMAMAIPPRCALPSVDLLREAYGHRRSFWGDLTAAETRRFYHELLPVSVYLEALGAQRLAAGDGEERPLGGGISGGGLATVVEAAGGKGGGGCNPIFGAAQTLEEQARLASMARHAARLYVRERCKLPSRVLAHLYDGLRHLKNHGSFRVTGMTWEELWEKYERKIKAEDPTMEGEELKTNICLRILEKSCSTSEVFNNLSGCSELNTFLPVTDSLKSAGVTGSSDCGGTDGDEDLLEGLENSALPAKRVAAGPSGDVNGGGDETSQECANALELALAAESAAACAGALRLTRLVKPFDVEQVQKDLPTDQKQSCSVSGSANGGGGGGGGGGGDGGRSRLSRLVPLPLLRSELAEALEQKRADQRLRKTQGKRKFRKRGGQANAA